MTEIIVPSQLWSDCNRKVFKKSSECNVKSIRHSSLGRAKGLEEKLWIQTPYKWGMGWVIDFMAYQILLVI